MNMNMNMVTVHTPNKTLGSRQTHLLVVGILMSSLLTACGGGGLSAEEKAAQAAADQAAAAQAAAAAAAQAAADHEAALTAARQEISDAVIAIAEEAKAAQTASSTAGYVALEARQQATSYQEVAQSVANTEAYAATAAEEADKAAAQKALVAKAESDVVGSQDLTLVQKAAQEAQQAASVAKAARIAAEKALKSTRAAAEQVSSEVKIAAARQKTKDIVAQAETDTKAAQSASSIAGYSLLQAKQQGTGYPEVAQTLAETQVFADQAEQAAEQALAQQALATAAVSNADNAQTLADIQTFSQQAQTAALSIKEARTAAEQARDATKNAAAKVNDEVKLAEAARRYTKLDSAGNALPASATSWACVKENATGKVWESKTNDNGLRDSDWRYRHFHNSAGYASTKDSNGITLCQGLGNCDAYSYVNAVNGTGLCGRAQWRLPTMEELLDLVQVNDNGQRPNIDLKFFPDTVNKPNQAAYCSENMAKTATDCGPNYTNPHYQPDGRIECNYQGVDYGLPISADNPRGGSMVALRHYGEVQDGLPTYPASNWICYTRLISSF